MFYNNDSIIQGVIKVISLIYTEQSLCQARISLLYNENKKRKGVNPINFVNFDITPD